MERNKETAPLEAVEATALLESVEVATGVIDTLLERVEMVSDVNTVLNDVLEGADRVIWAVEGLQGKIII